MRRKVKKRLLLDDEPIEREDMDEFRHSIFVDVLYDLVKNIDECCNIGLFGKWGTGKTSIVKMLLNRIRNNKKLSRTAKCLYFDAWKYSDESLRTQLLIELDRELGEPLGKDTIIDVLYNVREEEIEDKSKNISDKIHDFFPNLRILWISVVVIFVIDLLILLFSNIEIAYAVTAIAIPPLLAELISKINSMDISVKKMQILPKREWTGEFEDLFKTIVDNAEAKKIVIIIDNVDRCRSQTVVQILALLRTFMNISKCIYIIPCDDEAVLNHISFIDRERGYFTRNGQEFLRKIFQVMLIM